jgi:hypothetical protein
MKVMFVKCFYCVRVKVCGVGVVMLIFVLFLAWISCYYPHVLPLFIFALAVWLVTIVPAFYVEVVEKG